jgi:hypothetical protein
MKSRKIHRLIVNYGLVAIILTACNSGTNVEQTNSATTLKQNSFVSTALTSHGKFNLNIESDPYSLEYAPTVAGPTSCSSNKDVCVTLEKTPLAVYSHGADGKDHWLVPNFLTKINVTTNSNIKQVYVSKAYSKLAQVGFDANKPVGAITQLNDSFCKNLNSANNQCSILLTYTGILKDDHYSNTIHFDFSYIDKENKKSKLDLEFTVKNKDSKDAFGITDAPDLELNDSDKQITTKILPDQFKTEEAEIKYPDQIESDVRAINYGSKLSGNGEDPTIKISFINPSLVGDSSKLPIDDLDGLSTECGGDDVDTGQLCRYKFRLIMPTTTTSSFSNILMQYDIPTKDSGKNIRINYVKPFAVSLGSIIPHNTAVGTNENNFFVKKKNIGAGNMLQYQIQLSNVKIYAKYSPAFSLFNRLDAASHELIYQIGDEYPALPNITDWNAELSKITFNSSTDCLNGDYDPDIDGIDLNTNRKCAIQFTDDSKTELDKLSGIQLYASYDTTMVDKHVEQYIGDLTFPSANANPRELDNPTLRREVNLGFDADGSVNILKMPANGDNILDQLEFAQTSNTQGPQYLVAMQNTNGLGVYKCIDTVRPCHVAEDAVWSSGFDDDTIARKNGIHRLYLTDWNSPVEVGKSNPVLQLFSSRGYKIWQRISTGTFTDQVGYNSYSIKLRLKADGTLEIYDVLTGNVLDKIN